MQLSCEQIFNITHPAFRVIAYRLRKSEVN